LEALSLGLSAWNFNTHFEINLYHEPNFCSPEGVDVHVFAPLPRWAR